MFSVCKSIFRLLFVCCLVIPLGIHAKVVTFESGSDLVYDVQIDDIDVAKVELNGKEYLRAKLIGVEDYQGIYYQKGYAEIPVVRFYVNADNISDVAVTFTKGGETRSRVDYPLIPSQESLEKIPGSKVKFVINNAFYKTNSYWPNQYYSVEDAGTVKGVKRKLVTIYPFHYNPASNAYSVKPNFRVEVKQAPVMKRFSRQLPELFVFVVANRFKNSPSLQEYIDFKKSLGYQVETLVIGEDINNTDQAIRAALQGFWHSSDYDLKYAMLVGESNEVVSHTAAHIKGVTDHFYRAIDTDDYETDINGPDIGVGRITPKNEQELQNTLHKFIRYQQGDFAREDWLMNPSFIATDDRWQVAEGSHNYVIENFMASLGYTGIFPTDGIAGGDQLYAITHHASGAQVVSTISQGRFLINYSGHGSTTSWAGPHVSQDDVRSLSDEGVLPFVISNACVTGQFTIDESYGETWIKHPAGAIMFWGSMDSSYWDEDDIMEKKMYHGIYEHGFRGFSKITQYALSELWKHYGGQGRMKYYWETYVTFGDPSIDLRTGYTVTPSIEAIDALPIGVESIKVTLNDQAGNALANTKVLLKHEAGELISAGYTNEWGELDLATTGVIVGEQLSVVAVGGNLKMAPKYIMVVSPDFAYLVASNFLLNGEETKQVAPFQEVVVNFQLENVSDVATAGGRLLIESIEGPASVINGEIDIPALSGHEIYEHEGEGISFAVANPAYSEKIVVNMKWYTAEGQQASIRKVFNVVRGNLAVVQVDFGNPADPISGGMGPSESGEIFVTVQNTGLAPLTNATLELSGVSCIANINGDIVIDYLAPGEQIRLERAFAVTLNGACQNNDLAQFAAAGNYQGEFGEIALAVDGSFPVGKLGRAVNEEDNINLPIVDNKTTTYSFNMSGVDRIKDVIVHVRLRHTYQGDLEIYLQHPNGTRIQLRARTGGGADNIDEVYGTGGVSVPALNDLLNLNVEGTWKLEVMDKAGSDTGTLDYVKVDILGYI